LSSPVTCSTPLRPRRHPCPLRGKQPEARPLRHRRNGPRHGSALPRLQLAQAGASPCRIWTSPTPRPRLEPPHLSSMCTLARTVGRSPKVFSPMLARPQGLLTGARGGSTDFASPQRRRDTRPPPASTHMGTACATDCDGSRVKSGRIAGRGVSWEGAAPGGSDAMGKQWLGREMRMKSEGQK